MKKQFKRGGTLLLVLLIALLMGSLTGCQNTEGGAAAGGTGPSGAEPLSEVTELTGDCVVPDKQMAALAGKEGEYRFTGSTEEGITYTWIYDGKLVQNPQEQHLKVTVDNARLEEVKKAANHASVGLGITLEPMVMAAPADLELVLTEKWKADTVVYCQYQDGQVLRISDVQISKQGKGKKAVTVLTFAVPRAGGTYYLVGGSSKASPESAGTDGAAAGQEQENETEADIPSRDAGEDTAGAGGDPEDTVSGPAEDPAETAGNGGSGSGGAPAATAAETSEETTAVLTCTISIECSTILDNWEDLDQSKAEFVPADGWILRPVQVEFTEGETVFDVLKRVCKQADIHMASRYTPIYGSYYIEGINQLYEFDCGGQSGWNYIVNGWHPNYGCSSYEVSDGDVIEWRYTCDLGSDVGGGWN